VASVENIDMSSDISDADAMEPTFPTPVVVLIVSFRASAFGADQSQDEAAIRELEAR